MAITLPPCKLREMIELSRPSSIARGWFAWEIGDPLIDLGEGWNVERGAWSVERGAWSVCV
jgi:hypothetical protein